VGQSISSNYNPYNSSSAHDAAVRMMGLTQDDVRRLTPVNGSSIVDIEFATHSSNVFDSAGINNFRFDYSGDAISELLMPSEMEKILGLGEIQRERSVPGTQEVAVTTTPQVRTQLQELIRQNKAAYPNLFGRF
jgi:hypothetical protein